MPRSVKIAAATGSLPTPYALYALNCQGERSLADSLMPSRVRSAPSRTETYAPPVLPPPPQSSHSPPSELSSFPPRPRIDRKRARPVESVTPWASNFPLPSCSSTSAPRRGAPSPFPITHTVASLPPARLVTPRSVTWATAIGARCHACLISWTGTTPRTRIAQAARVPERLASGIGSGIPVIIIWSCGCGTSIGVAPEVESSLSQS